MLAKEKEKNFEVFNESIKMENEFNNNKKWNWAIVIIIALFVILSFIVLYIFRIGNMSIYNPYEVRTIKIKSEEKDWKVNDNINLFNQEENGKEKIIYPGQSGKYKFAIENTNSIPVFYKIRFSEDNKDKINIKYKLKLNNVYIVGDENTYETIEKMNIDKINIMEKTKSIYTIEWKWEKSDNDMDLIKNGLATYRIYIDIFSKYSGELYENY